MTSPTPTSDPRRLVPRLSLPDDVVPAEDWPDRLRESAEERAEREALADIGRTRFWDQCVPARFRSAALDALADTDQHRAKVTAYAAASGSVLNLLLWSQTPGVGKSYAAYAVGNHAVRHLGDRAAAWTMIAFNDAIRPGNDPTAYRLAQTCDLLVIDDVGRERITDWTLERFQGVLDERWANQRRTVITTNLDGEAFVGRYGDPIVDRLRDACWRLRFTGDSIRKPAPW